MKQKINLVIAFSTTVLFALVALQYYFVKASYEDNLTEFKEEVKGKIAKITNNYTDVDSTILNSTDVYYDRLISQYIKDKKFKSHLKAQLFDYPQRNILTDLLNRKIKLEFPEEEIDFAMVTNRFIIFDANQKADTIFSEKPAIENTVYGNLASLEEAFPVRNYVGATNGISNSDYKLLTEDTLFVSVKNRNAIILKRMSATLLLTGISLTILILLFVITLRALIRHKKHAGRNRFLNALLEQPAAENDATIITIGKYRFDSSRYELKYENQKQPLTEKEASLILFLYEHKNQLVKREQILKAVWGNEDYFTGRSMDVFISKLRKYFKNDNAIAIESIRNIGLEFKVK